MRYLLDTHALIWLITHDENTMEYSVIILKDTQEGGYIGMCRELPEAKSQGETIDELLENMKDAIKLTLEVRKDDQARRLAGQRPIYRKVRVTV